MNIKLNWGVFIAGVDHKAEEIVDVIERDGKYLLGIGAASKVDADDAKAPKAAEAKAPKKPAKGSAKK